MTSKERIEKRIAFREGTLEKLYAAYEALAEGGVQSYTIDDRMLTRLDISKLAEEIRQLESEIDALMSQLSGLKPRKAFGILPRDI